MNATFHPAAEAEYLEAIAFYESKRPGLGASYLEEFERVMVSICQAPHRNPMERRPDVRCMSMKKFPFTRIKEETRILVDEGDAITESLFRGLDREKRETLGRRHVVLMDQKDYVGTVLREIRDTLIATPSNRT